jgi:serine/threonine protein kinase
VPVGVILYILLSGTFPFSEENLDKELELGAYNFRSAAWSGVSASARHLVSRLMEIRPEKRMTADIALQHPWIKNESFAERGEAEEMGGNVADLIPRPLLSQLSWRRSWPRELDVNGERKPLGKEMTVSEDILARLGKMEIQSVHRSATESKREIALAKELPEDKIQEFEDSPGASFFGTKKRSRGKEAESSTKKKREVYLNNIRDSMALSTTLLNDVGIGEVENLNNIKVVAVVVSKTATSSSNMSKKKKGKDSSTSTSISTTQKKLTDLFKPSKK